MKVKTVILVCIFCFTSLLFAEDTSQEPSWVYFERAQNLKEKGDYAYAIVEARKSRVVYIQELLSKYYNEVKELYLDKTEYELKKMVEKREKELFLDDHFPTYHELLGDLFVMTNFLEEAKDEYQKTLSQEEYFEYPQKKIEVKYKLAGVFNKFKEYEFEDLIYREIVEEYFNKKNKEYWGRIKINIAKDNSLNRVFNIYRIEAMEYLDALYRIGRRSALLQKKKEALFFLVNAGIVWMTHYSELIKKHYRGFQYENPTDFINYFLKKNMYEYPSEGYNFNEILFYIGYIYHLEKNDRLRKYFFDLADAFSVGTNKEVEMKNRIDYFYLHNPNHVLSYEEINY